MNRKNKLKLATAILSASLALAAFPLRAATEVDVALGDISINKVPFLVAADAGIYAKNGLDVHQYSTPGAAAARARSGMIVPAQYVKDNAGTATILIGGGSPMLVSSVEKGGTPMVTIATTEDIARDNIVVRDGTANSFADLKGKRLGFSGHGAVTNYTSIAFVKQMGWDPDKDVTLVPGGANIDALKSGKVDAILASNQVVAIMPKGYRNLGNLDQFKIPTAGSGIAVKADWLAANRDTTMRLLKSIIAATALAKTDRKQFDASVTKWYGITDKKTLDDMYKDFQVIPAKPYPSVAGFKNAMVYFDSPAMKSHKVTEFYDSSFMTDLDKSGFLDHPLAK